VKTLAIILALLALSACSLTTDESPAPTTPVPPTETLTGTVNIEYPLDGTIVYSEVLYVSGTASGVPGDEFSLRVLGDNDEILAQWIVQLQPADEGRWTAELVHGYAGQPVEAHIVALPVDTDFPAPATNTYDSVLVALLHHSSRPADLRGSISSPNEDATISGATVFVSGTASGIFENTFTVSLLDEDGDEISSQIVTVVNPYFIDEVPFSVELPTNGYTGPAQIRAFTHSAEDGSEILIGSVNITVTEAG
jgi:hypothetical protein